MDAMPKLTKRFVDNAEGPSPDTRTGYKIHWDDDLSGFGLQVTAKGAKSYVIQYRTSDGRSRRLAIGKHGKLTPDEARKLAKLKLSDVLFGLDPAKAKKDSREAPSVADLAEDYLERHAIPNKRPVSVRDDRVMLEKIVVPQIGSQKVSNISQRDIEPIITGMAATPYRANRVRALLSKMFNLAINWQWRVDNPVRGIAKFPEHPRDRWLSEDELGRLNAVLANHPNERAAQAVTLLLLTGARRSEVFRATWDQFDLTSGVWTKPAHFTKQKRTEHTPLSAQAVDLLSAIRTNADHDSPYVFPGNAEGKPLHDIKGFWHKVCQEADLDGLRLHDLRHTFASHLASSGLSLPIIGRLLGHTQAQTTAPLRTSSEPLASNRCRDIRFYLRRGSD